MWAVLIVCLTNAFIYFTISHRFLDVGSIINGVWAAALLINILNPLDWYDLSNKTELYITLGVISLNIGLLVAELLFSRIQNRESEYIIITKKKPNFRMFFLYQSFLLIISIPMIYKAAKLLIGTR
jgi:hypothetical protein